VRHGRLTVYLGAAPGVGKTYAALGEARRRHDRGTDVVVGFVETHGRRITAEQLDGLEVVPRRELEHRGAVFTEMDVDAVLARAPAVAVVDEFAHTNVPGSRNAKRAQDIAELQAAGIDVITTVNVQHLESLNDEVEAVTGVRQRETVPDAVVRRADQIQLVDMSPEALRRRLAHGNIYRADQIDASLASYFRVGNLTALRELALLWVADRVDDALDSYRREHRIDSSWPVRERVVVAVTGGAESETLVRRGARIAQRAAGSELLAVHVVPTDGLVGVPPKAILAQRRLVESLDGTFHTVVGEDPASAVVDFAAGVNATMIVVGVPRHGRWRQLFVGSVGISIAQLAGPIDVHMVNHEAAGRGGPTLPRSALSRRRQLWGWGLGVLGPFVLTLLLSRVHNNDSLPTELMVFLAFTVAVALVGGLLPSLVCAVVGFLLVNVVFTPPVGGLTVATPADLVALLVFVTVAVGVASVVGLAARRSAEAAQSRAESIALASLSTSVLSGNDTAQALVERLRETFGLVAAALLVQDAGSEDWQCVAAAGDHPAQRPESADTVIPIDGRRLLALRGRMLPASDQRVLEAFAAQAGLMLEYRRLRERDARAQLLEQGEALRSALLTAVSHDLRTPLSTIRASVDVLLSPEVRLAPEDTRALTQAIQDATGQLERLIDNLLDLSRLQSGMLQPVLRPTGLDEVVPSAVASVDPTRIILDMDDSLPLVVTDAGLLERVVANVLSNAVRHEPDDRLVRVTASATRGFVELRVVDTGPGVSPDLMKEMFEPFQRLGDTSPEGLGLGLAVAKGLAGAVGATLTPEDTPGGGLTMTIAVPTAAPEQR
jgi:two-component system sensor histidine kinase KdpD